MALAERYRHGHRDSGSLSVELVVLTPVLGIFVLLALALGRYELAKEEAISAARAAAQAVAVSASGAQAQTAAAAAVMPTFEGHSPCSHVVVVTDVAAFVPAGLVRVAVSCRVDFSDLLAPGVPGATTVVAVQFASIDPYRSTQ